MRKTKRIKARETKKQKRLKKLLSVSKKLTNQKQKLKMKRNVCGPFPYMFIITFVNSNMFINLVSLEGETKLGTSAGRHGLKGRDKTSPLGLIQVLTNFFKTLYINKARKLLIKFNGFSTLRHIIKTEIKKNIKKYNFKILSFETALKIPFGGCRLRKKKRQ
jgi:ribosomal protein S11